jgi:hypothetical protein
MDQATDTVVDTTATSAPQDGAPAPEDTQQPAQNNQPPEWVPKRMGELAAARRAAEQRAQQEAERAQRLEQELAQIRAASQPDGGNPAAAPTVPPNVNVEQLARTYAEQLVQQQLAEQQTASRIQAVNEAGQKEFGAEYQASINNLTMAGVGGQAFLDAVTSVPNPEKLVTWLGKPENLDEAMRVAGLPPLQMGIEMTKLASRAAKELAKQVSKAPPPVDGVDAGGSSGGGGGEPKVGTAEWFEWRNKNARRSRR